ncbi:MAG TPA: helix-turn-helix domain-containing protein [Candidatus Saccharimonadales bacterium]|nr:helix-turn-helix domain-containing protein [Candidatus Saccharimonadales bacterium]
MNIIRQKTLDISGHHITVVQTYANSDGEGLVAPDGLWDILVYKLQGVTQVLLFDRPLLQPVTVPIIAGQEQLIISFHAGSYVTQIPRSEDGVHFLPVQNDGTFRIGPYELMIPTFETVEDTVHCLIDHAILVQDKVVSRTTQNQKQGASVRTVQRQFRHITGMTPHYYTQAARARQAAELLRQGMPAIRVAHELNYTDQFHMTHALKRFIGKTTRDILREKEA